MMSLNKIILVLSFFVFIYPLGMSIIWSIGASYFAFRRERGATMLPLDRPPMVSTIVPFFNEEDVLESAIKSLLKIDYPRYEIILVNDGCTDKSLAIARSYTNKYSKIRLIEKNFNEGKAAALNDGILASKGKILLFIDADAVVKKDILKWLVPHFQNYPRVAAVTGHPMVRNRTNLTSRLQVIEFSSIISLIKRAQRIVGKIFTVSGVVSAVRRTALADVDLYDTKMATGDIDMSWRLQKRFFDVRFEPNAIVWMSVPETIPALFKQRLGWALGGLQVLVKHFDVFFSWKRRRFWPIYLDSLLAVFWAINFYALITVWLAGLITGNSSLLALGVSPLIQWYGSILALLSLSQMGISVALNLKHDKTLPYYFFWAAWYPIFYWFITSFAVIVALPILIFGNKQEVRWLPRPQKVRSFNITQQ